MYTTLRSDYFHKPFSGSQLYLLEMLTGKVTILSHYYTVPGLSTWILIIILLI